MPNEEEIKKSIANRRAIFWKGEWDMVCSCGECPMPYRTAKNPPQLECVYYGGDDYDLRIEIEDEGKIHNECGLPYYDRVRKYTANEKPLLSMKVEIKFFEIIDGDRRELIDIGWYEGPGNYCWNTSGHRQLRDIDIIFWRYIL